MHAEAAKEAETKTHTTNSFYVNKLERKIEEKDAVSLMNARMPAFAVRARVTVTVP